MISYVAEYLLLISSSRLLFFAARQKLPKGGTLSHKGSNKTTMHTFFGLKNYFMETVIYN